MSNSRWLIQQAGPYRSALFLTLFSAILSSLANFLFLGLLAWTLDTLLAHHQFPSGSIYLSMLACLIVKALFLWLKEIFAARISVGVRSSLRETWMRRLLENHAQRETQASTAELSARGLAHIDALDDFYTGYLPQIYILGIIPLLVLIPVFAISWVAGVLLVCAGPLIPLFMILVGMGAASAQQKHFQALSRMSTCFLDTLQGLSTLKLFGQSRAYANNLREVSESYRQTTMKVLRLAFLSSGVLEFFSAISIALLAFLLGLNLLGYLHFGPHGHLSLFQALFLLLLAPEFFLPFRELGARYHAKTEAEAAIENLLPLLKKTSDLPAHPQVCVGDRIHLHCENLSFQYEADEFPIIQHLNLSIAPGEILYVLGESGEGKTTLLNLLLGFLKPTAGRILVNNQDLQGMEQETWLEEIAWVGQASRLFYGSILDNLLLAKPAARQEDLERALHLASATALIQGLPQGLHTLIQEQNAGLSGGEVQRILLARAFLKEAPILLLDEPTASLDPEHAENIWATIREFSKTRTVVIVTHHLEKIPETAKILRLTKS